MSSLTVTTERIDVKTAISSGLRTEWITGDEPATGMTFELDCGAGLGSPYLTLRVQMPDGEVRLERVDIRVLLKDWVKAVKADEV